jgi:hypothetical protein
MAREADVNGSHRAAGGLGFARKKMVDFTVDK